TDALSLITAQPSMISETPCNVVVVATTALPFESASMNLIFRPDPARSGEITTEASAYSASRFSTTFSSLVPAGTWPSPLQTPPAILSTASGRRCRIADQQCSMNHLIPSTFGAAELPTNKTVSAFPG